MLDLTSDLLLRPNQANSIIFAISLKEEGRRTSRNRETLSQSIKDILEERLSLDLALHIHAVEILLILVKEGVSFHRESPIYGWFL